MKMKVFSPLVLASTCALLFGPLAAAYAQDTILENWDVNPNRLTAQTCKENVKKCGLLLVGTDTTVSELTVRALGGRDMRIDYCAKVQDPSAFGAKCDVEVNGVTAAPGGLRLSATDTEYSKCLTWFATAQGNGRRNNDVVVQCKAESGTDDSIDISESVTSVWHQ